MLKGYEDPLSVEMYTVFQAGYGYNGEMLA